MKKTIGAMCKPLTNEIKFGPWKIKSAKGTIMKSDDSERSGL